MKPILAVFDIDGTLRKAADPWLHLHRYLNTHKQGESFYRQWLEGKISYRRMARLDASVWKGITKGEMIQALDHNPLRQGATKLVARLKNLGAYCLGLSTGLSIFNDLTAREVGLDTVVSNELDFENEVCTGRIHIRVEEHQKADVLETLMKNIGFTPAITIVLGDGLADIPLFQKSDVSIAVFPRSPKVVQYADLVINREPIDTDFEKILGLL